MKYIFNGLLLIFAIAFTSCQKLDEVIEWHIPMVETSLLVAISIILGIGFLFCGWANKFGFLKESAYEFNIDIEKRTFRSLIIALFVINILILMTSVWSIYYYYALLNQDWASGSELKNIFILFNIGVENTIATWYASMIFLMIGLIILLIFFYKKQSLLSKHQRKTVWGWLLLSLFFIGLSSDEMGSLHERLGLFFYWHRTELVESGFYTVGTILGIIAGLYMIWFFFTHLYSYRRSLIPLVFGVLGIIPVILFEDGWDFKMHQLLETVADLKQIILISMLEEGLELFSSWFLLAGFMLILFKMGSSKKDEEAKRISITVQPGLMIGSTLFVIAIAVLGVGVFAPLVEFGIEGGDDGITRNWFPAALAITGAIFVWMKWAGSKENKQNKYIILTLILTVLSIYHGANFRFWLTTFESIPVSFLLIFHILLLLGIAIFILFIKLKSFTLWQGTLLALWFLSLAVSFFAINEPAHPLDILPFIFLYPFLISVLIEKKEIPL